MTLDASGNVVVTSQGYVKKLFDTDGDGQADTATLFANTEKGGMGLCADGADLYLVGDGGIFRFQDLNQDGVADGPPDRLFAIGAGEHGGHAVRKGPDGWFYLIGGNDSGFGPQHVTSPSSAIRNIEAGALIRFSMQRGQIEPVAHGFRNPYDFDFNGFGEIFTYDSDVESDLFLPWYTPTRLYHVTPSGHYGWRLNGWRRSWNRPPYYVDTVDTLAEMGRGSPTGVTCYRHYQFPLRYRNGLFALDWTFGRIFFSPLAPSGASYQASPEIFMEPLGSQGLAPTDVVVAPDGSLLVSIGGRKTRGAIYRIDFPAAGPPVNSASNWLWTAGSEVEAVLNAPQPLDAWSRAFWVPLAARVGMGPFLDAAVNGRLSPLLRVRAVEVLTELFGGLSGDAAALAAQANSPLVRGRVAWSLGRTPKPNSASLLTALARDGDSLVRRCALEALFDIAPQLTPQNMQQAIGPNLAHPDERIRQESARLATYLPEPAWKALWSQVEHGAAPSRLTACLALLWRDPPNAINVAAIDTALSVLGATRNSELRLQAVRLIILALGDYRLNDPSIEVFTAYEPALGPVPPELAARIRRAAESVFPSGDVWLDTESSRLLAMVNATPAAAAKAIALLNDRSPPSLDFHYLAVLAKCKTVLPTNAVPRLAHAILALDRKLDGQEKRPKQNWSARLAEVVQMLVARDPRIAMAMINDPQFARPAHVPLAGCLGSSYYTACAQKFLEAVEKSPGFAWSGQLVDLLASLPRERVFPLLRRQWANFGLRDEIALQLAQHPVLEDRDRFITALGSTQTEVVRACLGALLKLPRDESGKAIVPTLKVLRRALGQPDQGPVRIQALSVLKLLTGESFKVTETSSGAADLRRAYEPVFTWFGSHSPGILRQLDADDGDDPSRWAQVLKNIVWNRGDPGRGAELFRLRGCETCHASATPIGPDLGGITERLQVNDLFNAIIFPSRDVAPPYRTTTFRTRDGQSYTGVVVFESADGVIVQTGAESTVRLAESNIASRQTSAVSLMPSGLLTGLRPQSLADLYSYLASLSAVPR